MRRSKGITTFAAASAVLVALSGCQVKDKNTEEDLVVGKKAFVGKCGSCHILSRADSKGVTGPNLDEAFRQSLIDGFKRDTIKNMTEQQILYPAINGPMPAKLAEGDEADQIAAYVAYAVAKPGEDEGAIAAAVPKNPNKDKVAAAEGGMLVLDADPSGQLFYTAGAATAMPGPLTITSKNTSQVDHNIALDGGGADVKGEVVKDGGTSTVKFTVQAGEYSFYCSVPGHREGGMEGKLSVK